MADNIFIELTALTVRNIQFRRLLFEMKMWLSEEDNEDYTKCKNGLVAKLQKGPKLTLLPKEAKVL